MALTKVTPSMIEGAYVSVLDFGAVANYNPVTNTGTDNTVAIQNAIKFVANDYQGEWFVPTNAVYSESRTIIFPSGHYYIAGTVHVPSNITLDFNGSTLWGPGVATANHIMFDTGYVDANGDIQSNLLTGDETNRVMVTRIQNGIINNCNVAFRFKNFNENCWLQDISFSNCGQCLDAQRCFYAGFQNMAYRGLTALDSDVRGCFKFTNAANLHTIRKIAVNNRKRGFEFAQLSGTIVQECSAENGEVGMWAQANMRAVTFLGCYFEDCTECNIDLSNSSNQEVTIQGCYLPLSPVGIKIGAWVQGKITSDNNFIGTTEPVRVTSQQAYGTVEVPTQVFGDNAIPFYPSGFTLPRSVDVQAQINIFNTSTGLTVIKQKFAELINLPYSGKAGGTPGGVAFSDVTFTAPPNPTFNVFITTRMIYEDYNCGVFNLFVTDNVSTYKIYGRFYGPAIVVQDDSTGKVVTLQAHPSGWLILQISSFSNPSGTASVGGIVRHM